MNNFLRNFKIDNYSFQNNTHEIWVGSNELYSLLERLNSDRLFVSLRDIAAVDLMEYPEKRNHLARFEVMYNLHSLNDFETAIIHVEIEEDEVLKSVGKIWGNGRFLEHEIFDLMGIQFDPLFTSRYLLEESFKGHPLRKNFNSSHAELTHVKMERNAPQKLEFSSSSKSLVKEQNNPFYYEYDFNDYDQDIGNVISSKFILDDDIIIDGQIDIGHRHKGFEKEIEKENYFTLFAYLQKLDPTNSLTLGILNLKMLEEILEIEVSSREKYLRMVLLEWERIINHLQYFINFFRNVGGEKYSLFYLKEKKQLESLLIGLLGSINYLTTFKVGSRTIQLDLEQISLILRTFKDCKKEIKEMGNILIRNNFLIDFAQMGIISSSECLNYGITGPTLRATGINYDLRKTHPFYFYRDIKFDVPLGDKGSIYDRYLIRHFEILESIKIIVQILENLPHDENLQKESTSNNLPANALTPTANESFSSVFEKVQENDHKGIKIPRGKYFSLIEAASGEIWTHLISSGELSPYRFKLGSSHFSLLKGFTEKVKGTKIQDYFMLFNSFGINVDLMER